jgi:hypothetical protein
MSTIQPRSTLALEFVWELAGLDQEDLDLAHCGESEALRLGVCQKLCLVRSRAAMIADIGTM